MQKCPVSGKASSSEFKCPFSSGKFSKTPTERNEDPPLTSQIPAFTKFYISPYIYQLEALTKRKRESLTQFNSFPAHLQNTLFHAPQIQKQRTNALIIRLLCAQDLKLKGNASYWKNELDEAMDYYDHAIGIFCYLERDGEEFSDSNIRKVEKAEESLEDKTSVANMLADLKTNLVKVMLKAGFLRQAKQVNLPDSHVGLALRAQVIVCNLEASVEELTGAVETLEKAKLMNECPEYTELTVLAKQRLETSSNQLEKSLKSFAGQLKSSKSAESDDQDYFEYGVVQLMELKYQDLMKFNRLADKPITNSQTNYQLLQATLARMHWINSVTPADLSKYVVSQDLLEPSKLVTVKHQLMREAFDAGTYNQELLEYCIKQKSISLKAKSKNKGSTCFGLASKWVASLLIALLAIYLARFYSI